jgi:hypothetical protein
MSGDLSVWVDGPDGEPAVGVSDLNLQDAIAVRNAMREMFELAREYRPEVTLRSKPLRLSDRTITFACPGYGVAS